MNLQYFREQFSKLAYVQLTKLFRLVSRNSHVTSFQQISIQQCPNAQLHVHHRFYSMPEMNNKLESWAISE